jgi:nucleotide-binding universal stress UspA family protein
MFQKLVICTDFEDGLLRLASCLDSLAVGGIREVVFFHYVPMWEEGDIPRVDDQKIEAAHERFASVSAGFSGDLVVKFEVRSEQLVTNLLDVIQHYGSDLVILGSQSRTLLNEKIFGSTTTSLTEKLPVPMLVIRPVVLATFTDEELNLRCQCLFRHLLVAYDGTEASESLINMLIDRLQVNGQTMVKDCKLGWVMETTRRGVSIPEKLAEAETMITATGQRFSELGLETLTEVRTGDPIAEVIKMAGEGGVSAIAVTAHSLPKFLEWSRPSFPHQLLRSSFHPVLFFPPQR